MKRRILIYIMITLLSYFFTRYFLPFTPDELKQKTSLPETAIIRDPLDVRGGWMPLSWIIERFEKIKKVANLNRDILIAIATVSAVAVGEKYLSALSSLISDASPVLKAMPLPFARELLLGFDSHNPKVILKTLYKGMMNPTLSFSEKLIIVQKSLSALVLATKSGMTRQKLIVTAIVIATTFGFASAPALGGLSLCIQDLFTQAGFRKSMVKYVIDIYKEYNAPFPLELVELATKADVLLN
jgi:hypothetical protein